MIRRGTSILNVNRPLALYSLNIVRLCEAARENRLHNSGCDVSALASRYHTMVTGRDDLDKSSGGPGIDGGFHTAALGFSDAIRCDGSTDVTRGGIRYNLFLVCAAIGRLTDVAGGGQFAWQPSVPRCPL